MTTVSTCLSRHLPPPVEGASAIVWFAQVSADAARVKEWTCATCDATSYELCTLGGVWFLRRRTGRVVHETHRLQGEAGMRELWHRLLVGVAL